MTAVDPKIRRRARERAVQYLFGRDFTGPESNPSLEAFWEAFPSKPAVRQYAELLLNGVTERGAELDALIDASLLSWAPERVGKLERNVLRVALFEMMFRNDVPRKVAINEAIEVVKVFGSDDTARFVNGVLDRIPVDAKPADGPSNKRANA